MKELLLMKDELINWTDIIQGHYLLQKNTFEGIPLNTFQFIF